MFIIRKRSLSKSCSNRAPNGL